MKDKYSSEVEKKHRSLENVLGFSGFNVRRPDTKLCCRNSRISLTWYTYSPATSFI